MARRFPAEVKVTYAYGIVHAVRFRGTIPHGKRTREVELDLRPEVIVAIAKALEATKDCACDTEWQRARRHHSEFGYNSGHAMWHVENPDRPMPCVDHSKVIDMGALPVVAAADDEP